MRIPEEGVQFDFLPSLLLLLFCQASVCSSWPSNSKSFGRWAASLLCQAHLHPFPGSSLLRHPAWTRVLFPCPWMRAWRPLWSHCPSVDGCSLAGRYLKPYSWGLCACLCQAEFKALWYFSISLTPSALCLLQIPHGPVSGAHCLLSAVFF